MKDVKGINKWIVSVLMLLVALVILVCGIFPLIRITVPGLSGKAALLLESLGAAAGKELDALRLTWTGELGGLLKKELPEGTDKMGRMLAIYLSIPYLLVVITAVLGLFRRFGTNVAAACTSFAGLVFSILSVFVLLPAALRDPAAQADAADGAQKAGIIQVMPDVAWWVLAVGLLVLLGLALFAILSERREAPAEAEAKTHGIRCGFGELRGMDIPLYTGKDIVIGSDKSRCNYVAFEEGIEAVHCRIRYTGDDCYEVTNHSRKGIVIDGKRVVSGNGIQVRSGTTLILSSRYLVDLL